MGVLGEIMFVTNIVYVAMITFDILVDISIPNIRQNGLADAYFVVVVRISLDQTKFCDLLLCFKRNPSSMETNKCRSNNGILHTMTTFK